MTLITAVTLSFFAVVAASGIVATVKTLRVDGYRRVPTRRA